MRGLLGRSVLTCVATIDHVKRISSATMMKEPSDTLSNKACISIDGLFAVATIIGKPSLEGWGRFAALSCGNRLMLELACVAEHTRA